MAVGTVMGGVAVIVALFFAASGRDVARSKGLGAPSSVVGAEMPAKATTAAKTRDTPPSISRAGETGKHPRIANAGSGQGERVWTREELKQHDGTDAGSALLLAILGEVYDVGPGARFYGPSGGYSRMAGCDNSRAYTSIDEDDESDNSVTINNCDSKVLDLKRDNIEDILNWRDFYREHKEYRFVGVLCDRYFGADGSPTPDGQALEEVRSVGKQAQEIEQQLNKRFMSCNMKHESAKTYVELWCSDGYHPKGSKPVHFYYRLPQKEEKGRCACLTAEARAAAVEEVAKQAYKPQPGGATYRFVEYSDCEKQGQMCRRPKGAKPPL